MINDNKVQLSDSLDEFNNYLNRDFWRAFKGKPYFENRPRGREAKREFVEKLYSEIQSWNYYPSTPQHYVELDKGNGVVRITPIFTLEDYGVFYYCIKKMEAQIALNRVANTFGGWTLGGAIREREEDEMRQREEESDLHESSIADAMGISIFEHSFNPLAWVKAYGDLNAKLYASAKDQRYKYVAELDIANYYDSINLGILEMKIREAVDKEHADVVSLLFHFLSYWNRKANFYNKQTVGIPQDFMSDCSRILANFYLQPYDQFMFDLCEKTQSKYLRYADDQFFFANNKDTLHFLIFKASKKLNSLGLSINSKKVELSTVHKLIERRAFEIFNLIKSDSDRNDENKVEAFVDYYLNLINESKLSNIKNNGISLLSTALSCPALGRIDPSKKAKLLNQYLDHKYLKNVDRSRLAKIYKLLDDNGKAAFIHKLNYLSQKLIHNAFHYELMYFYRNIGIDSKNIENRFAELKKL